MPGFKHRSHALQITAPPRHVKINRNSHSLSNRKFRRYRMCRLNGAGDLVIDCFTRTLPVCVECSLLATSEQASSETPWRLNP